MANAKHNQVVVLIPAFNSESDLRQTLASIAPAEQVDVLVVDDGSHKVLQREPLEQAYTGAGKLHLLVLPENRGITGALNAGLDWSWTQGYPLIARLDAGDLSRPDRFAKQQAEFEKDETLCLLGGWARFVDEIGKELFEMQHPTEDAPLRLAIRRYNPFVHPAVMIRASALKSVGGYPTDFEALEDWACFLLLMNQGTIRNLPEPLIDYVVSPTSISSRQQHQQAIGRIGLLWRHYDYSWNSTLGIARNLLIVMVPRRIKTWLRSVKISRPYLP